MQVFVAGATGAVGKRLVPALVRAGHTVTAMTRSAEKTIALQGMGATPCVVDAFDRTALAAAMERAKPEIVVHQMTALPAMMDFRRFADAFAETNRLRTQGLDNLLSAARSAGVRRFVAQSYAGWPYARIGGAVKGETDPLDPHPAPQLQSTLDAIRYLEETLAASKDITGIALRYGTFYGPGTGFHGGGAIFEAIKARKIPLVGGGGGVWSFSHMDDVASATVAAIERGAAGVYNVVDDDPAPASEWLPYLAQLLGAKRPWRVPAFLARLFIGAAGVEMMTDIRGASNAKAKRELEWSPRYESWRQGFAAGLAGP